MDTLQYILWFIIILAVIILIMIIIRPIVILQRDKNGKLTDHIMWGRMILISLLLSIISMIVLVAINMRYYNKNTISVNTNIPMVAGSRRVIRI